MLEIKIGISCIKWSVWVDVIDLYELDANLKEIVMAIASAVEKNGNVYLYNEKGGTIAAIPSGIGPKDGLQGYTATSVSIRRGLYVYVYNEKGGLERSIATS